MIALSKWHFLALVALLVPLIIRGNLVVHSGSDSPVAFVVFLVSMLCTVVSLLL